MKKTLTLLSVSLVALALVVGCYESGEKDKKKTGGTGSTPKTTHVGHVHACAECGYLEEDGKCQCEKGGEKCKECGLIKGSPGCCDTEFVKLVKEAKKNKQEAHIAICEKCGNIEDGERCCEKDKGAKICPNCKTHEGSLICKQKCGVKKTEKDGEPSKS